MVIEESSQSGLLEDFASAVSLRLDFTEKKKRECTKQTSLVEHWIITVLLQLFLYYVLEYPDVMGIIVCVSSFLPTLITLYKKGDSTPDDK